MRVHHLNCGSMRPVAGGLLTGADHPAGVATMVCHCLLVELADRLLLIDTGLGLADAMTPRARLSRAFRWASGPALDTAETAARQVEALGLSTEDVRDIVVTHLDPDHAGGLSDFPAARVHVLGTEHAAATAPRSLAERTRYRAPQWAHHPTWVLYEGRGEPWFGFETVRDLDGIPPEVLLVPLTGHTRGHVAVAVATSTGWLLHCGDAYFHHAEVRSTGSTCPSALRWFQRLNSEDWSLHRGNQARLRELLAAHGAEVTAFCSHDPWEWSRLVGS